MMRLAPTQLCAQRSNGDERAARSVPEHAGFRQHRSLTRPSRVTDFLGADAKIKDDSMGNFEG